MRFALTARALVRQREREESEGAGNGMTEIMAANVRKVTRFREGGEEDLEREVRRLEREGRVRGAGRREEMEERDEEIEEGREYEDMNRNVVERTRQGHDLMRRRR